MPYRLSSDGKPTDLSVMKQALVKRLNEAKTASIDSPIFQLVEGFPEVDHTKTDIFRDRVRYSAQMKEKLATARKEGLKAIQTAERELGEIQNVESGIAIDLFLSYRAVEAWAEMIELVKKMSPPLAATVMVQEQLALALNRYGKGERSRESA